MYCARCISRISRAMIVLTFVRNRNLSTATYLTGDKSPHRTDTPGALLPLTTHKMPPVGFRSVVQTKKTILGRIAGRTMATKARFSDGTDEATATPALNALLSKHWTLAKEGEALERSFKFKTFSKTWVCS
ncbi:uncharacterized protein F5Z01DRAFT_517168 [Emericellopsis atlantica]|uniref:4a-hydroxytetrahydrobiopterin dehydratase n=1 Tax=Emericellopsis atlantica TaxID=2614577 RepID=A0A9P7ZPM4_9HYPO|nr:uncharacterized protein F5Z01DRAFT_517168 [Emericellopsis atlantica]KAG9255865.1 hypothetical protein F5Z01DRAFT_517168 [Emericellopsis atlantica]